MVVGDHDTDRILDGPIISPIGRSAGRKSAARGAIRPTTGARAPGILPGVLVASRSPARRASSPARGGELVLYAQPLRDARTLETREAELLVRLRRADGRVLAPGAFLPMAERRGVVHQIDRWVIMQAARLAAEGKSISVNVSARSVCRPEMAGVVRDAIAGAGAPPGRLTFELTETALMECPATAARFAREVVALGCGFALDDFGTGYGGLAYLKNLPVNRVKLDREFVGEVLTNPAAEQVVAAMVALAESMGHSTVGEGIESMDELEAVCDLGVDLVQGYLLGRPEPVDITRPG